MWSSVRWSTNERASSHVLPSQDIEESATSSHTLIPEKILMTGISTTETLHWEVSQSRVEAVIINCKGHIQE